MKGTRIVSEQGLHFNDLSAEAKETAIKSFVSYYVEQYRQNNLEILGAKVSNQIMGTINEVLHLNKFMDRSDLEKESYRLSKPSYEELLEQLTTVSYQEDGTPVNDWEDSWEKQEEELPSED